MDCSVNGCLNKSACRGFCHKHYWRFKKYGDPNITTRPRYVGQVKCKIEGCGKPARTQFMCNTHYDRFRFHGNPHTVLIGAKGTGYKTKNGYVQISENGERTLQHILIVEKILGKKLPRGAEVHHINCIEHDNRPENLVICPTRKYHFMLHRRARALDACGNPDWIKCAFCKKWDDPKNLVLISGKNGREYAQTYHRECRNKARRKVKEQRPSHS